ncbi:MAG TPA: gliding motility-associated ABC transporter ATP-binding subunit GldA [Mariniphaga sp.]|nr:gliding motility-associated ABC transporter ATP-binding subunit GldA [Mariniphaga sp.]
MKLSINDITKLYGKQKALDSVSFSIQKGELLGFLGPNGAGKSTLMKIVTGYLPATSGEVWIDDKQMTTANTTIRNHIGYLPEHNPLYTDLYVRESIDITAGFYDITNRRQQVAHMIELTGLGDEQHKKIGALSKGYRQRVGLAQALIHDPQLLILDEPTTGLDPNQLDDIRKLIRNISKEKTVILSSHIMQEVEAVCSRVVIINKGRIVADGSITEIKSGLKAGSQQVIVQFNREVTAEQLLAIKGVLGVEFRDETWVIEAAGTTDIRPAVFKFAVEQNLIILTLMQKQQNLEGIFHQLTRGLS